MVGGQALKKEERNAEKRERDAINIVDFGLERRQAVRYWKEEEVKTFHRWTGSLNS